MIKNNILRRESTKKKLSFPATLPPPYKLLAGRRNRNGLQKWKRRLMEEGLGNGREFRAAKLFLSRANTLGKGEVSGKIAPERSQLLIAGLDRA